MEQVPLTRNLPVVPLTSVYFAGRSISLPHTENTVARFGDYPAGNVVRFNDDGEAFVNPEQAAAIAEDTMSYAPFVSQGEGFMADFTIMVDPDTPELSAEEAPVEAEAEAEPDEDQEE